MEKKLNEVNAKLVMLKTKLNDAKVIKKLDYFVALLWYLTLFLPRIALELIL